MCHFVDIGDSFLLKNGTQGRGLIHQDGVHLTQHGTETLLINLGINNAQGLKCTTGKPYSAITSDITIDTDTHDKTEKAEPVECPTSNLNKEEGSFYKIRYSKGHADPLSNFYPCALEIAGEKFKHSEAAYQFNKTKFMAAYAASQEEVDELARLGDIIQSVDDPGVAKEFGCQVETNDSWQASKIEVMKHILEHKVNQCEQFRNELIKTAKNKLIENTKDRFWARGENDCGNNILGSILESVQVRVLKKQGHLAISAPLPMPLAQRQWPAIWHTNTGEGKQKQYSKLASRNSQPICDFCGEAGHLHDQCRHGHHIQCTWCHGWGHKAKKCSSQSNY
jgi:ribA/ribD-fused uncharacterized protein